MIHGCLLQLKPVLVGGEKFDEGGEEGEEEGGIRFYFLPCVYLEQIYCYRELYSGGH